MSAKGYISTGSYTSSVKLDNDPLGNGINDVNIISSRFNLGLDNLLGRDRFVMDVRDKHDFFGATDRELLELKSKNTLLVRQLAYEKPWRYNRFFYSVGRFEMFDAGIYANDGISLGYRINLGHRIGLIAGLADKTLISPRGFINDDSDYNGQQAALFWVYESAKNKDKNSTYLSQSLISGPTVELEKQQNNLRYHQLGIFHISGTQRYTSLIDLDITPTINLRKALFNFGVYRNRYRFESSYRRIHQDDFRLEQDIREVLAPSKIQSITARFIDRISRNFSMEYNSILSNRIDDGLFSYDLGLGLRYKEFLSKRMSIGLLGGYRNHYLSKDTYAKLKVDYYSSDIGVHVAQIYRSETYDDSDKSLNPLITRAELSFYLNKKVRGSAALNYTSDKELSIISAYLMIAYHFTGKTSQVRTLPAEFESL